MPASSCELRRRDSPPSPPPAPLLQETPPSASIKSLVHSFKINYFLNLHYARLSSSLLTGLPASALFSLHRDLLRLLSLWAPSPLQVPLSLTVEAKSSLLPSRPHKMSHCSFCSQPHPLPFAPQKSSNTPAQPCLWAFALAAPSVRCSSQNTHKTYLSPPSSLYSNVTSKSARPTLVP